MIQYRFSSDHIRISIGKYGHICHTVTKERNKFPITDDEFEIITTWSEYKARLKKIMIKHLITRLNPKLKFDKRCLEHFGFKACSNCFHPEATNRTLTTQKITK